MGKDHSHPPFPSQKQAHHSRQTLMPAVPHHHLHSAGRCMCLGTSLCHMFLSRCQARTWHTWYPMLLLCCRRKVPAGQPLLILQGSVYTSPPPGKPSPTGSSASPLSFPSHTFPIPVFIIPTKLGGDLASSYGL